MNDLYLVYNKEYLNRNGPFAFINEYNGLPGDILILIYE